MVRLWESRQRGNLGSDAAALVPRFSDPNFQGGPGPRGDNEPTAGPKRAGNQKSDQKIPARPKTRGLALGNFRFGRFVRLFVGHGVRDKNNWAGETLPTL